MSETEPIQFRPSGVVRLVRKTEQAKKVARTAPKIAFNRSELTQILSVYGRKVADGEWRDYAIDALKEKAVFSVFRRTTEYPLYRIEKQPKLSRKQGAYSVVTASGLIVKRGHDLAQVLRSIEGKPKLVVA